MVINVVGNQKYDFNSAYIKQENNSVTNFGKRTRLTVSFSILYLRIIIDSAKY